MKTMLYMLLIISFMTAGAILNRVRGGFLPTGHTQVARLIYAAGFSILIMLVTFDWMLSLVCVPALYLGSLAPNGAWMHTRNIKEVLKGSFSGLVNVGFVCAALLAFVILYNNYNWLAIPIWTAAGLLKGPLYWIAWRLPDWQVDQFHQGPEMGEVLFGASLGLATALLVVVL